jgi:hypothetical protein
MIVSEKERNRDIRSATLNWRISEMCFSRILGCVSPCGSIAEKKFTVDSKDQFTVPG